MFALTTPTDQSRKRAAITVQQSRAKDGGVVTGAAVAE
jgi:hypothetical protein